MAEERPIDPLAPYREQIESIDLELKLARGKAEIRQSWLYRENIASIVGAILLLIFAATLVVAMFVGTTATDVVTNAFLLILGYFFGQSVARERQPSVPSE